MENLISSDIGCMIADLANHLHITETDVLRQTIRDYAEKIGKTEVKKKAVAKRKAVSCLESAKEYAGCIEAEEDLSTNKAYMNGYGL